MGAGLLFVTPEVSVKLGRDGKRSMSVEGESEELVRKMDGMWVWWCRPAKQSSAGPVTRPMSWDLAQRNGQQAHSGLMCI